jgi:hypothetical protein
MFRMISIDVFEPVGVRLVQCIGAVRRMQSPTGEILCCLDLGTMVSEDLCSEGGHSSGRLSEAS